MALPLLVLPLLVPFQDALPVARDWPSFRGPRASGIADGQEVPAAWDLGTGENVLWRADVPGLAHSSPIVWDGRVFVTTAMRLEAEAELSSLFGSPNYGAGESVADEGEHAFLLLCFDAASGELLWERTAHVGVPRVKRHPKSSHANPTPACDGRRVVASFGSEGVHAFSLEGEPLWSRDLGVLECGAPRMDGTEGYQWGYASSPVIHGERVLVQCDVQGQSFVAALDLATGADAWRTLREEEPTWCTPTVHEVAAGGRAQVILNGYDHIGGYDLATGAEIWKLSGGGDVPVPTPVVAGDLVYLTSAHGRDRPIRAVRVTAEGVLEEPSPHVAWHLPRSGVYMQTPLAYRGLLYACSDAGILGCYDALTGEELYRERLGGGTSGFTSSPVAAEGRIYFASEAGEVVVVRAGREFEVLSVQDLGDVCMSTPAIAGGRIFFRTQHELIALAEGIAPPEPAAPVADPGGGQ